MSEAMQTVTATTASTGRRQRSPQAAEDGQSFEEIWVGLQSAQFAGLADALNGSRNWTPDEQNQQASSQAERVRMETEQARQSEVQAHATRRADPSSVQNGVVSSRHERILETRSEVTSAVRPETGATAKATASEPMVKPHNPEPQPPGSQSRPLNPAASTGSRQENAIPSPAASDKPAANAAPEPRSSSPGPAAHQNPAVVNVTTAGAAARAAHAGSSEGQSEVSAAKAIGQMLGGRGAVEAVRAGGSNSPTAGSLSDSGARNGEAKAKAGPGTAGSASGPETKDGTPATRRSEFLKLVQQVRLNAGTRMASATLRLDPPELGKMRVAVRMVDDALQIRVETSTPRAREVLQARAGELAAALREHRIDVQRFEVVDASPEGRGHMENPAHGENQETATHHGGMQEHAGSGGSAAGSVTTDDATPDDAGVECSPPDEQAEEPIAAQDARLDLRI